MLVRPSKEELELEAAQEWQERERAIEAEGRKQQYDYRITKMKVLAKERHRIWLNVIRLPLYLTAVTAIFWLTVFHRDIPESLTKLLDN